METQNRSEFEQEWEKAFADAELEVSPGLWEKVELDLMKNSNGKYKRRLLLFQLLAAASVAFALSVAGVGVYQQYNGSVGVDNVQVTAKKAAPGMTKNAPLYDDRLKGTASEQLADGDDRKRPPDTEKKESMSNTPKAPMNKHSNGNSYLALARETEESKAAKKGSSEKISNTAAVIEGDAMVIQEPNLVAPLFAYLEIAPHTNVELRMVPWYNYIPSKKAHYKNIWAGIGFSAGSFNPNAASGATTAQPQTLAFDANARRTPAFTEEEKGQAVNLGVNVGARLSEKWVLQSGLVYIQQNTTSTSNVVATSAGQNERTLSNAAELTSTEDYAFTAPYDVENTYEIIAIPVQAGYVVLDKKLSVIVLSGVSNNILLKNEIGSRSRDFEDAEISSGSKSRYRTYQISGMLSSEFNYQLSSNYSISLVPQIRQAINSITKPEVEYSSHPTTLEVGFRIKYIFSK